MCEVLKRLAWAVVTVPLRPTDAAHGAVCVSRVRRLKEQRPFLLEQEQQQQEQQDDDNAFSGADSATNAQPCAAPAVPCLARPSQARHMARPGLATYVDPACGSTAIIEKCIGFVRRLNQPCRGDETGTQETELRRR